MASARNPLLPLAVALGAAALLAACSDSKPVAAPAAPPPPQVAAATVSARPVPLSFRYAGRVSAFREVEVRARVPGILVERSYVEGAHVKAGDVLFRIDPATYEAELARAKAGLQEARAQLARAQRDSERAVTLFQRQIGTEKARDDAVSAVELAKAAIASAEAQVKTAEINLGYTTVTAPISGTTSLKVQPEGSLVGTGEMSLLARISQLDTVYVNFAFTDTDMAMIRQLLESGRAEGPRDGRLIARVDVPGAGSQGLEGPIDFTDSSVDLATGTIRARAVVATPGHRLRPGQFVRVSIEGVTMKQAIVVPQAAVMQGPQGQFVYALDAENKVAVRPVKLGREVGDGWLVDEGLGPGDRIVTEGVIKVQPGKPVSVAQAPAAAAAAE